PLRYLRSVEPYNSVRFRREGDECRLNQPLQVDRKVEWLAAQAVPCSANPADAFVEREGFVDKWISFDQRHPSRANHPRQPAVRKTMFETCDGWQSVNHISHRAQPHYQNSIPVHRAYDAACWRSCTWSISFSRRPMSSCSSRICGRNPFS